MIKQSQMSPDVLIYVQSIKKFFSDNISAKKYFAIDGNEEKFYNDITQISQRNYEEHGEPELTIEQFEMLRKNIPDFEENETRIIASFLNLGELGHISLN